MKPKTLLNTDIKPEAVKAPIAQKALNVNVETRSEFIITSEEVKKVLGISDVTFKKWISDGRFNDVRMLKRNKYDAYRFIKADFLEWLNKSLVSA